MGITDWFRRKLRKEGEAVSLSGQPIYMHKERKERPFGRADLPEDWARLREEHYERWLGPSKGVYHEIISQVPHIDVYVYPPAPDKGRDYYTVITGGMSDLPMHLPKGVPERLARAELILYAKSVEIEFGSTRQPFEIGILQFLARFPFEYQTWLAAGHTIPNGNPPEPFAPGSKLTTALLTEAVCEPEEFREGLSLGGKPVNLLWVQFITDAECALKLRSGAEALYELMDRKQPPQVLDLYRPDML